MNNIVISRCAVCHSKFKPNTRVNCVDCDTKIHNECYVRDNTDILCLSCYRNRKINIGLARDGIIVLDGSDDECMYCGWRSEFNESHIEYGNFKCKTITDLYNLKLDDIGDIVYTKK